MVGVDALIKAMVCKAIPAITVEKTARFIIDEIVTRVAVSRKIVTDNGSNITSEIVKKLLKKCGVHHITISAYNARANAQVEIYTKAVKSYLTMFCNAGLDDRNSYVKWIALSHYVYI